jgi:LysR family glycine cleavage system transcriptional activator
MSLLQPTIDAGRLLRLFDEQLPAEFAHYLVYPPRSQNHAGLAAFREWVVGEAGRYADAKRAPVADVVPPRDDKKRRKPLQSA